MNLNNKGQAGLVFVAILALIAGIIAFIGIYSMNAKQNLELASTVAERITVYNPTVDDLHMETIKHAAKRHGPIVYTIVKVCNEGTPGVQTKMTWHRPEGDRDAYVCLVDNVWWVVVKGEPIDGDDIVTVFPRESASLLDDVIES